MQEHEYKARDKTVQKMSRDGLREENLRNKEEKRITGRDTDTEISRSEKKEELDFSKRRHERLKEEREMEQPEQSSRKPRYSREHVYDQDINSDMGEMVLCRPRFRNCKVIIHILWLITKQVWNISAEESCQ